MLRCPGVFRLVRPGLVGLLAGGLFLAALERDTPLFLNLGPGDEAFARGFRGGWERDGLQGAGETAFRWTEDGARLELPVVLSGSPDAEARLRLARFLDTPVEMSLYAGDRLVERWTQPPRGWSVRRFSLGPLSGPLQLRFRSAAADPADPLGVALDWLEVSGAGRLRPRRELLPGLLALLVGLPLLLAFVLGRRAALAGATLLLLGGAVALCLDRLGSLVALSRAGVPALLAGAALALAARLALPRGARAAPFALALAATGLALVALSHPGYHYPDVDTHARFLQALRREPGLALDASAYQAHTGAWTREIAGHSVAFPYFPAFHLLAWPLALVLGAVAAVKTLGAVAVGVSLLLAYALACAVGLSRRQALLAPALLALLPVTSSRLALALLPTLLGQACELLLFVALARQPRPPWRRLLPLLLLAQAAYTGSLFDVAAVVGLLALLQARAGQWAETRRLLLAWALAAAVVVALLYGRFLPSLWRDVLPHLAEAPAGAERAQGPALALATRRLGLFYDVLYPLLVAAGGLALRAAPAQPRRVLGAILGGGLGLLGLRFLAPTLFRDAKEIELLAPGVAVVSAAALAWLWSRGRPGRALAAAAGAWALGLGALRGISAYADRFVAIGR